MSLLIRNARILTLARAREPGHAGDLGIIPRGDVTIVGKRIVAVGERLPGVKVDEEIDADGRVLMPGFVDCHTHACWAGDRLDEWELKLKGVSYLEILQKGGGIHSTVRAVRAASQEELAANTFRRLQAMLQGGTTTAEVKSGYGLTTVDELKMLRAIKTAAALWPGTVVPTALLGHAFEGDHDEFVAQTIAETLPAVSEEFPGITVDAFCETGAWSVAACRQLLVAARKRGHPCRLHADQFHALGMVPAALDLSARSVDHLEATTDADLTLLAFSTTFGVILPCTGFHTDGRYSRARRLIDLGGRIALATNYNPGSAPTYSMPFAIALAVRHCGLAVAEAIIATTAQAAALLGLDDRGTIERGQRADLILLRHHDERLLAYEVADNPLDLVICDGSIVGTH